MAKGRDRKDRPAIEGTACKKLKANAGIYSYSSVQVVDDSIYRGEMAGLKVKSHLESLMGTDIIKLNDRQYMASLQDQLKNEYDILMNKQEEQRSEKERRRQRRLYIEGLQDLPNIDSKQTKSKNVAFAKSAMSKPGVKKHNSQHALEGSDEDDVMNPTIGLSSNPSRRKHQETRSKSSPKRRSHRDSKKECEITLVGGKMSEETSKNIRQRYAVIEEDPVTRRAVLMRQLKREGTVQGLYRTADLVLAAPVTEVNGDADSTVQGSPHASMSMKSEV